VDSDAGVMAALEKDLELAKEKLHNCTQDYLKLRHDSQGSQRRLREQAAALQAANNKVTCGGWWGGGHVSALLGLPSPLYTHRNG
jgi:hypothetical protein